MLWQISWANFQMDLASIPEYKEPKNKKEKDKGLKELINSNPALKGLEQF